MFANWKNAIERDGAPDSGPILHLGDLPSNCNIPPLNGLPRRRMDLASEELERRAISARLVKPAGQGCRGAHAWHRQTILQQAQAGQQGARRELKRP